MPANRPFVLGLTGGIGSGKSEAARCLRAMGAFHIDADAISRALTSSGGAALPAIRREFGDEVFNSDGSLDRRRLGDVVFADPGARHRLEAIVHPLVAEEIRRGIEMADARVILLDVPLLFESGLDALCDEIWTMSVDMETQVRRVCERDGLTEERARARIANQMNAAERASRASRVIVSDRPIAETRRELCQLYRQLLERIG